MTNWYDPAEPSLFNQKASDSDSKKDEAVTVPDENVAQERWNEAVDSMIIEERLSHIQNEMKVPKNLFNRHGNYYYRNAETIMNTAKPICAKYRCTLVVEDEVKMIGERYYVVATATLSAWARTAGHVISCQAFARETAERKGMDASQITGAASSYARKYALNGLFNLDDVKDADTDEYVEAQKKENPKNEQPKEDPAELAVMLTQVTGELRRLKVDVHDEKVSAYICEQAKVDSIDPGKLILDLNALKRVLKVMSAIVSAKESK